MIHLDPNHIFTQRISYRETVYKVLVCSHDLDGGTRSRAWEGKFLQVVALALKLRTELLLCSEYECDHGHTVLISLLTHRCAGTSLIPKHIFRNLRV